MWSSKGLRVAALLCTYLALQAHGINEVFNTNIIVADARPECVANAYVRPCPATYGAAKLTNDDIPVDSPCPCPANGSPGGGYPGATGTPTQPNANADFFVDEVLADGFINPVAMSFSDNTPEMFVAERGGRIWYVNLETGEQKIFTDLSAEVGFSGDRGLMDVVCHPNYGEVKQILTHFVVDHTPANGEEPHAESAANQRVIRLQDLGGGVINDNFRLNIIGAGEGDGVAICYNTHALGSLKFGLDASLFVTTGEGAHWNFDVGDWGQDAAFTVVEEGVTAPTLDPECVDRFGPEQDVGAMRSQVHYSLSGKVLRITPDAGDGICEGSATGGGYPIKNPYCDASAGTSFASKIWSVGLRNPFRATVRPLIPGEFYNGGPGVLYFGDVGQGGYEEINAVTTAGMNFGWPCWEGPLPSPSYRDSPYNLTPYPAFQVNGCPGVEGECGNITSIATLPNGERFTCRYMYKEMTTILPFYYWTRFQENDNAGYFGEIGYTGSGAYGATTAGLEFYRGTKYPQEYQGKLFALEFSDLWIRVIEKDDNDLFVGISDFADLIYTEPVDGARHTLASGPDGNICYITMNGGEVRCFRFVVTNVPPTVGFSFDKDNGPAPLTVKFHPAGTSDRENDMILFSWNFGDGSISSDIQPTHTFTTAGQYDVMLIGTDKYGNSANHTRRIYVGNSRPVPTITSPIPDLPGRVKLFAPTEVLQFSGTAVDEDPNSLTYRWEFQFVHNNHIHPDVLIVNQQEHSIVGSQVPQEIGAERVNLLVFLTATDAQGLSGRTYIRLANFNWETMFNGNVAPVPDFTYLGGYLDNGALLAGQPIKFSAQSSVDDDGDRISYQWDYDDGFFGEGVTSTHTYSQAGSYLVTLFVEDNWGYNATKTYALAVGARKAIEPVSSVTPGEIYESVSVTFSSVEPGATIVFTLDGTAPTPCSPVFDPENPLEIPFTPYTNITVFAQSLVDGVNPSPITPLDFILLPPPCTQYAFGAPGELVCLNSVDPLIAPGVALVPPALPVGTAYTTAPPTNPDSVLTYTINLINGEYDTSRNEFTQTTRLSIWASQGNAVGAVMLCRVSYDFTGDGTFDRVERFHDFGPDPIPTTYEEYTFNNPAIRFPLPDSIQGSDTYLPLVNGTIRVEIWEAIQNLNQSYTDPLEFRVGRMEPESEQISTILIPYKNTYQFREYPVSGNVLPTSPVGGTTGCNIAAPTSSTTGTNPATFTVATTGGTGTNPSGTALTTGVVDNSSSTLVASILLVASAILLAC